MSAIDSTISAPVTPDSITLSCLCLDFTSRQERYWTEFSRFIAEHQAQLSLADQEDPATAYLARVWPHELPGSAIFSNITVREYPLWLMRPPSFGPLAESYAADGQAPAFSVYRKRGQLVIVGFNRVPHAALRSFEQLITAPIYVNPPVGAMTAADFSLLERLIPHRQQSLQHLVAWEQYLDWRESLAHLGQVALPYDRIDTSREREIRFHLAGMHDLANIRRRLAEMDILTAPLEASQAPDRWQPRPEKQWPLIKVGSVVDVVPAHGARHGPREHPSRSAPDAEPVAAVLVVSPPEDADLELPERGFILSNIGGDLKPLNSERAAIHRLRTGRAANPYLADVLFDIRSTTQPEIVPDIFALRPPMSTLNDDQRQGSSKAVVAPDIFLLQGPPGTGKTTAIAEIAYQIIRAGGYVLISAQANLAVDNVCLRLANRPEIRPLRIGQSDRVDPESRKFLPDHAPKIWFEAVRGDCRARLAQRAAAGQRIRTAEEGFGLLGQTLERAAAAREEAAAIAERLRDLQDRLKEPQAEMHMAQERLERLSRQSHAASELDEWAGGECQADPPAPDLLADSPLSDPLRQAAEEIRRLLAGMSWPPSWLPAAAPFDPAVCVAVIHAAARACQAALELDPLISEAMALCHAGAGLAVHPHLQRIRELEDQKSRLLDSDQEENLKKLAQINRELKTLRLDRWSSLSRALLRLLTVIFHGELPAPLDELAGALQPQASWTPVLKTLRDFNSALATGLLELLRHRGVILAQTAQDTIGRWRDEMDQERNRNEQAEQTVDHTRGEIEAAERQLQDATDRVRECEQRWRELWPTVCPDLETPGDVPSPGVESLQTRRSAFDTWLEARAPQREREHRWHAILMQWPDRLSDAEAERPAFQAQYARHANLVGATCFETGQRDFYEQWGPFDVAFLEEASKMTPTELLMPALLARKIILVGDHHQLLPLFRDNESSYTDAAHEGHINPEDFARYRRMVDSSIFRELFEAAPETLKHSLRIQYRMHSQIMAADNPFYGGQLQAGPSEEVLDALRQHHLRIPDTRGGWLLEPHNHLLWLDSTKDHLSRPVYEEQRGSSKVNRLEVELTVRVLVRLNRALRERGYGQHLQLTATRQEADRPVASWAERCLSHADPTTVADLFRRGLIRVNGRAVGPDQLVRVGDQLRVDARMPVGVITFYGAQLREIQRRIETAQREEADVFAALDLCSNTVDRFQGMERAIVLVSLVRARPHLRGGEYVRKYNRINVAFSRAQDLLIIIGSERTFADVQVDLPPVNGNPGKSVPVYRDIHNLVTQFGGRRYARQLIA